MEFSSELQVLGRWRLVSLLGACVLLLSAPYAAGFSNHSSSNLPFGIVVPGGYFEYIQIPAPSSSTSIAFAISSNTTLSTAFMTSSQLNSFNNSNSEISDSVYLHNGTAAQQTLHEPQGIYYLVFYAYGSTANVSYNYQTYPIDPYFYYPLTGPEPTGVAAFGLYNESGSAVPYQVESGEVVGIADISSMEAYNASASSAQSNISGATLQLNSILVVNEQGGNQQVYWAQNTPDFVTAASQVAYGDNLWNYSISGFLSNSTVTSVDGGLVSPNTGYTGDYYSQEINNSTYSFPLVLVLINETAMPGQGVLVQMGAQMIQNGTASATPVNWFDSITIHDPTVQSVYFLVTGNQTTADGLYYDTELVFGGESNGESTNFTQMSASLGLFYDNSTTGALNSFPSLYSFGSDTAEGADNLHVSYSGSGFAQVTTGSPDYVYLGTASGTLTFPLSVSEISPPSTSSSSQTTASTSTQGTSTQTSQSSTSSASQSGSSISISDSYLLVLLVSASVLMLTVGLGLRRKVPQRLLGS